MQDIGTDRGWGQRHRVRGHHRFHGCLNWPPFCQDLSGEVSNGHDPDQGVIGIHHTKRGDVVLPHSCCRQLNGVIRRACDWRARHKGRNLRGCKVSFPRLRFPAPVEKAGEGLVVPNEIFEQPGRNDQQGRGGVSGRGCHRKSVFQEPAFTEGVSRSEVTENSALLVPYFDRAVVDYKEARNAAAEFVDGSARLQIPDIDLPHNGTLHIGRQGIIRMHRS
jgi:hypothetical protein